MKYFEPEKTFEPEILNDSRTRAYTRYQRRAHIARKKRIIHNQNDYWGYKHEGELNKGKIHCSCWLCRCKSYEWLPKRDMIQIESMNQQLKEIA